MQEDMVSMLRKSCSCDYVITNKYATWLDCTKKRLQCRGMFVIFFYNGASRKGLSIHPCRGGMCRVFGSVPGNRGRVRVVIEKWSFPRFGKGGKVCLFFWGFFYSYFGWVTGGWGDPASEDRSKFFFISWANNWLVGCRRWSVKVKPREKKKLQAGQGPGDLIRDQPASLYVCLSVCLSQYGIPFVNLWNSS